MNTFGNRLKAIREQLELSQDDFAERLNLTAGALREIEKCRTLTLKESVAIILVNELRVNLNWLFTGSEEPFLKKSDKDPDKIYEITKEIKMMPQHEQIRIMKIIRLLLKPDADV